MLLGNDLKEETIGKNKTDRLYERFMASEDLRNKIREESKNCMSVRIRFSLKKDETGRMTEKA